MFHYLRPYLIFWGLGLLAFTVEYFFPARPVSYRSVFLRDITALATYNLCFMLIVPLTDRLPIPNYVPASVLKRLRTADETPKPGDKRLAHWRQQVLRPGGDTADLRQRSIRDLGASDWAAASGSP